MKNPSMTRILSHFEESARLANDLLDNAAFLESMEKGAAVLIYALRQDAKILSCGNGGSMCDAMHFAEELSGRYRDDRPPLAALALSDASTMTCVGNDYGFDQVFARQINALGRPGDVLLAISTSGNSGNILEACRAAKAVGMQVVSLTGNGGGTLRTMSDVDVCVPWSGYADRIQEVHIRCIHSWIDAMEQALTQG